MIIDRYVLRSCLVPTGTTILIGLLVLSAARFLIIFDLVLGNDQGMLIVARMLAAFVPHYLGFMLPLALYWGSFTVVRQFTVSSEASVLQATGSSIARCFAALLVLGVVFACVNLVVVGWLQPLGRYSYRALTYHLEKADYYLRIRDGTFTNVGPRTIFVEKINPDRRSFEKILIYEPRNNGGSISILAPRGTVTKINDQLTLRLNDGQRLMIPDGEDPDAVQTLNFDVLDVPVGEAVQPVRPRGDDELELLLPELLTQTKPLNDASVADISEAANKKLVIALSCLFLPMLAVSLGVQSSRRRNPYQSIVVLLIVIVYQQLIDFAGNFGRGSELGAALVLWTIFAVYFVASLLLFYKTTTGIGPLGDRLSSFLARLGSMPDPLARLRGKPQAP